MTDRRVGRSRVRPARIIVRGRLAAILADAAIVGQEIAVSVAVPGFEPAATGFRVTAITARRSSAGDAWAVEIEEI